MRKLLLLAILLISSGLHAQNITNSPYSYFGVGTWNNGSNPVFRSMGNTKVMQALPGVANPYNAASYAFLLKNRPVLNVVASFRFSEVQTSTDQVNYFNAFFDNFFLAFPMGNRFGAGIGMMPLTQVGYDFESVNDGFFSDSAATATNSYQGLGGVNKLVFGLSFMPIKNFKNSYSPVSETSKDSIRTFAYNRLSLGVNGNYLFGTDTRTSLSEFSSSAFRNTASVSSIRYRGWLVEASMLYALDFAKDSTNLKGQDFTFGATYQLGTQINANETFLAMTYPGGLDYVNVPEAAFDTIASALDQTGKLRVPQRLGTGFSYGMIFNSKDIKRRYLRFTGEIQWTGWDALDYTGDANVINYDPQNSMFYGFGLEFIPHKTIAASNARIGYMELMSYRLGFNYEQTQLNVNNNTINKYGINFGLGFPIRINNAVSSINIGFEWLRQGTLTDGLILEDYYSCYLGFSLSPGRYDRWFSKRKID